MQSPEMELEENKQEERKVKKSVIENQLPKDFEPLLLNMQSGMVSEHGWVCGLWGQAARFKSQLTVSGCVEGGSFLCLSVLLFIGCKGELMIVPASSGYYED